MSLFSIVMCLLCLAAPSQSQNPEAASGRRIHQLFVEDQKDREGELSPHACSRDGRSGEGRCDSALDGRGIARPLPPFIKRPQIYGTEYLGYDQKDTKRTLWTVEPYDRVLVPDALRLAMC